MNYEEERRGWARWVVDLRVTEARWLGMLIVIGGAWQKDPILVPAGLLFSIVGQVALGGLVLTEADYRRFKGGDFWVAAAWLALGTAPWLVLACAWSPLTSPVGAWFSMPVILASGSWSLWMAEMRQTPSSRTMAWLLPAAAAICGVFAVAMIVAPLTLFVGSHMAGGFLAILLAIPGVPLTLWLAYRFLKRRSAIIEQSGT